MPKKFKWVSNLICPLFQRQFKPTKRWFSRYQLLLAKTCLSVSKSVLPSKGNTLNNFEYRHISNFTCVLSFCFQQPSYVHGVPNCLVFAVFFMSRWDRGKLRYSYNTQRCPWTFFVNISETVEDTKMGFAPIIEFSSICSKNNQNQATDVGRLCTHFAIVWPLRFFLIFCVVSTMWDNFSCVIVLAVHNTSGGGPWIG